MNRKPDQELPIVLLYGPRGSGKTSLVDSLAVRSALSASLPYLRFDCESYPAMEVWQMVAYFSRAIAGGRWAQSRPIWFPRATLGTLVLSADMATGDPQQIEDAIYQAITQRYLPAGLTENLPTFVDQVRESLVPSMSWLSRVTFLQPLLDWALTTRKVKHAITRTGMGYYGDRMGTTGPSALTELVRLRNSEDPVERERAGRIVCEALLEDMAQMWSSGWRPCNCLLLLDNADAASGKSFLRALAAAKAARYTRDPAPPLAVLATSRSWLNLDGHWLCPGYTPQGDRRHPTSSGRAGLADWVATRATGRIDRWWYPVLLDDLTRDDVEALESVLAPHRTRTCAGFVYELTAGHPKGTRMLLDVIGQLEGGAGVSEDSLRGILAAEYREPGAPAGRPMDTVVVEDLLRGVPQNLLNQITRWSATRDLSAARNLPTPPGDATLAGQPDAWTTLAESFWLVPRGASETVLHPWLRRVLLHRLSSGPTGAWESLYTALRESAQVEAARRCYDLAAHADAPDGRAVDEAVTFLTDEFSRLLAQGWPDEWIALLERVGGAPLRRPPDSVAVAAAHPVGSARAIIRNLLSARRVWADPLADPWGTGTGLLVAGFFGLAALTEVGRLSQEAMDLQRGRLRDPWEFHL
ncbi:ATP-binding protein [Streptomyces sp. NPDC005423]|uniref:ATP-binding protein n=1 Tax=Streptomyces sp. NPDC005423 TaxID=3155343 RepID=UPI0033B16660